ncbi:MAG: DUF4258 domain-containing protein [Burkholderiales bacterium]
MKTLAQIRQQLTNGQFDFSQHAFQRAVERNISEVEIRAAGVQAQIIEEYPEDKYSPSILILGFTTAGRALHLQVSLADADFTKIITLYEPDPEEWENNRNRR